VEGASRIIRGGDLEFSGTDRYRIVSSLGAGGMGVVYKVHDRDTDTLCALKTLRTREADALSRFKNEFRALQDLRHPNLISLGELGEVDGSWYFTMELVEGSDLLSYVRSGDGQHSFSEQRTRKAFAQVLRGLSALHGAGMVHRDIKPSNIRVRPDGRAVLLDFGLVLDTLANERSKDSWVIGTAAYMAPEQAQHEASPATDCYALGVILYEALTGEVPFTGTDIEILMKKQREEPTPPSKRAADIPADLEALCLALLRTDPVDRPTAAQALERLGEGPQPPSVTGRHSREPPGLFVGRDTEVQQVLDALREPRAAHTFAVRGPTGVGKTALVQKIVESARREYGDVVVLRGRCYERETVRFKAVDGVVDALTRFMRSLPKVDAAALLPNNVEVLSQVFPVLRRVDVIGESPRRRGRGVQPQELRRRAFASLRELFSRIAMRRPLLVIIDDLQWADADSIALLKEIMTPPDIPPMVLLVAQRNPPAGAPDPASRIAQRCTNIEVGPLDPANAHALAAALLERTGAEVGEHTAGALAREADGHPLFIHELARFVASSGQTAPRLVQLDDALRHRFEQLTPEARTLMRVVGVVAGPLHQEVAALAADLDFGSYSNAAQELRLAYLARTTGARRTDSIEPYHDRIWEAVQGDLADGDQRDIHRRLGLAFEASGVAERTPEFALRHFEAAGQPERAAFHAEAAADHATSGLAFDRAALMYRRALELGHHDAEDRRRLESALANALVCAGRGPEAADMFLALADGADPVTRLDLKRRAAEQLLVAGYIERGTGVVRSVLREIGLDLPSTNWRAIASLLWNRFRLRLRGLRFKTRNENEIAPMDLARLDVFGAVATGLTIVDNIRAADFIARYLRRALDLGEPRRIARALSFEANQHSALGNSRRAERLQAELDKLVAERGDGPEAAYSLLGQAAKHYFVTNQWRSALDFISEVEARVPRDAALGAWEGNTTKVYATLSLLYMGELDECRQRMARYLREADQRGDRYLGVTLRTRVVLPELASDNVLGAEQQVEQALHDWMDMDVRYQVQHFFALHSLIEIALYAGNTRAAGAHLAQHWPGLKGSGMLRVPLVSAEISFLRGRIALARALEERKNSSSEQLIAEALGFVRELRRNLAPASDWMASALRASVARLRGKTDECATELEQALHLMEDNEATAYAQVTRRRLAGLLGGDEGAELRSESDHWMAEQGVADPDRLAEVILPGWAES